MSLPFSSVVAVSGVVQSPAFTMEKQHMILVVNSNIIPTTTKFLEFTNVDNYVSYFGKYNYEYKQINKYFSFMSKTGLTADKVIIVNWYKEGSKSFIKGSKIPTDIKILKEISSGSFNVSLNNNVYEVVLDLTNINDYNDIASLIENKLKSNEEGGEAFKEATCVYNDITKGLIITNGTEVGIKGTTEGIFEGKTGINLSELLGLSTAELSQGVNKESWTELCDRIYKINTTGFSITTLADLENEDIKESIEWLQTIQEGQTYNTAIRLVFDYKKNDLNGLIILMQELQSLNYTGYVMIYDPNEENINILDCAICASTDYEETSGTKNFNFQNASGYTPITNYGSITDYQAGQTNLNLVNTLDKLNVSYIYSLGAGINEVIYYGKGSMNGSFKTEDIQANEAWLERDLQINIINALNTLEKIKLQGTDAIELMNSLINPSFTKGQNNGAIAYNGILSETDKLSITQATGNNKAPSAVESNGYYFKVVSLTQEDINEKRVRIVVCYLAGGVVNSVRIINNIYGA